jgi:tetratricopeptide (TPR) repeat protein
MCQNNLNCILNEVEHHMQMGDFTYALTQLIELSKIEPDNFEIAFLTGECYLCLNQEEMAIQPLKWAIKLLTLQETENPESYNWEAYYLIGCAHMRLYKNKKALKYLEQANILSPNNGEILRNIGWLKYISKQKKAGRELMEKAVYLDPQNAQTYNDIANTYLEENNIQEATKWVKKAIAISPHDEFIKRTADELQQMDAMNIIFSSKKQSKRPKKPLNSSL